MVALRVQSDALTVLVLPPPSGLPIGASPQFINNAATTATHFFTLKSFMKP
jgi:hypothetical protein